MPQPESVHTDVASLRLTQAPGGLPISLGEIGGVQILVLLRHRH